MYIYPIIYTIKIFLVYKGDCYYFLLLLFNLLIYNIYILYSSLTFLYLYTFRYWYLLTFYIYCKALTPVLHILSIFKLVLTLHIGFLNIHPILLYIVCILGCGSYLQLLSYRKIYISIFIYVWVGIIALIFGMYWGVFSFLWGFFWVNDLVEWFLLFLIIALLFLLHNSYIIHFKLYSNFYIFLLLVYISAIRLNLVFTRHSFFFRFFINNLLIYFIIFFLSSPLVVYTAFVYLFYYLLKLINCTYFLFYSFFFSIIWVRSIFFEASLNIFMLHFIILLVFLIWITKYLYYFAFFYLFIDLSYKSVYYFYINYFSSSFLYIQYLSSILISSSYTLTTFTIYSWFYSFIIFYKVELSLCFLLYFYSIYIISYSFFQISNIRLIWL